MALGTAARRYVKNALIGAFEKRGYEVRPTPSRRDDREYVIAKTVKDAALYGVWEPACPVFSPWLGHPDFQRIYAGVAPHTLVSPESCYFLMSFGGYALGADGEFAECGVFQGGTALLLSRLLKGTQKRLHLFDSFQGLPKPNALDKDVFNEGQYAGNIDAVRNLLSEFGEDVVIHRGWIPQTFAGLEDKKYAFVHLDVDLYQSNLDCLEYFYPRLVPGGVIVFDEYGFAGAKGEKDAVDEFFADKPEKPTSLPTGQAFVLKLLRA